MYSYSTICVLASRLRRVMRVSIERINPFVLLGRTFLSRFIFGHGGFTWNLNEYSSSEM